MLLVTVVRTCYAFGLVFTICELGQLLSNNFDEISEIFEQYDWYLFSEETNQRLLTITMILQQSIALECFGSLECGHEAFKKVGLFSLNNKIQIHSDKCIIFHSLSGNQFCLFVLYGSSWIQRLKITSWIKLYLITSNCLHSSKWCIIY